MLPILLLRGEMRWNKTNSLITDPKDNGIQPVKGTEAIFTVVHANKLGWQWLVTRWGIREAQRRAERKQRANFNLWLLPTLAVLGAGGRRWARAPCRAATPGEVQALPTYRNIMDLWEKRDLTAERGAGSRKTWKKIKPQMKGNWGQNRNRCALKIEGQGKDRCKGPCK